MSAEIRRMWNCAPACSNHTWGWEVQKVGSFSKTAFLLCKFVTLEEAMVGSQKHPQTLQYICHSNSDIQVHIERTWCPGGNLYLHVSAVRARVVNVHCALMHPLWLKWPARRVKRQMAA
ncbi:nucleolar MIF4G domain-containing protein 1 [Trichinella spiralis]|uniref:nucleolar MIF4G domain-containing protein 1 n=1 Tax=Trichinella spiralis TaxID=6334 RepID=UPI0001EFC071|nr:nucleolar MIF4G domain-containing protein 1 [Trichinella spiralis]